MTMNRFRASPLSRLEIRRIATQIRGVLNIPPGGRIDIVRVVERLLGEKFNIATMEELGENHGLTIPKTGEIFIREDIYERACRGAGRDRLTIAHEFGHLILHDGLIVGLARIEKDANIPAYADPEWQATAFASELLMPAAFLKGNTVPQIASTYGVSSYAASYQLDKIK